MDARFKNQTLGSDIKNIVAIEPKIVPEKGVLGGFSIDYVSNAETNTSENILYRDEESRDQDFELLMEYLNQD